MGFFFDNINKSSFLNEVPLSLCWGYFLVKGNESPSGGSKCLKQQSHLLPGPLHIRPTTRQITFNDRLQEMGENGVIKGKGQKIGRRQKLDEHMSEESRGYIKVKKI